MSAFKMHIPEPNAAERLLAWPRSRTVWPGAIFMAGLFLTGDYLKQRGSLVAAFARTARSLCGYKPLRDFIGAVNDVDDRIDSARAEHVAGGSLGDFLENKDFCPALYFETLDALIEKGFSDRRSAAAFSNIFARLMHSRATEEILARESDDPSHRLTMTEMTQQVTKAYLVFVYRCLNRYRNDYKDSTDIDFLTAVAPYPDISRLARLGQIVDDIRDFHQDLQNEADTGIITPNWLASEIARRGGLTERGRLNPEMRFLVEAYRKSASAIAVEDCPEIVRACLADAETGFMRETGKIRGAVPRTIMKSFFYNTLREGFKPLSHPDIVEKKHKEARGAVELCDRFGRRSPA